MANQLALGSVRQSPPASRWTDEAHRDPQQDHCADANPCTIGGQRHEPLGLVPRERKPGHNSGRVIHGFRIRFGLAGG